LPNPHRQPADSGKKTGADVPPPILEVIRNLILPVYLPSTLYAIAHNAIQILLPLYALKLGGGFAMAAAMVGMRGIGTMLLDVPSGLLVARFGDKAVMGAPMREGGTANAPEPHH